MSVGVLGSANLLAVAFGSWTVLILGSLQGRGITIAYLGRCLDLDYFIIGFVSSRVVDLEVTGDMIDDGTGLDQGTVVWTGDGPELAE